MSSPAAENYLKTIHALQQEGGQASLGALAATVGVTPGTATTMVKRLAADRLVKYERYAGVSLTPRGEKAALDILRRHRLVETFLVRTLRLDWSLVHLEAERLEHAISPAVLEALDAHLGRPTTDPHGDPIPDAHGKLRDPRGVPLSRLVPAARARVTRVLDQEPAFLSFIARHGLMPSTRISILTRDDAAGLISVQAARQQPVSFALAIAAKILVEEV